MEKSNVVKSNLKAASVLRGKMVMSYTKNDKPYAVWYECIHGEYRAYQNDCTGCAELLLRTENPDEMTGFMYLLILLYERGEKPLSTKCVTEILGIDK